MNQEELVTRLTRLTDSLVLADGSKRMYLENCLATFIYQNMNISRSFRTALVGSDNIALSLIGRMSANIRLLRYDWPENIDKELSLLEGDFMRAGVYLLDGAVPDMIPDEWT